MLLPALLLLAQSAAPTMTPQMPTAPLPIPRKQGRGTPAPPSVAPAPRAAPSRLDDCLGLAQSSPAAALDTAAAWAQTTKGAPAADPALCRGMALSGLGRWDEAEQSFAAARDLAQLSRLRARYGALAGNAALAAGSPARADAAFAAGYAEARTAIEPLLAADIAIDRSRALIALKRESEAAAALDEGRRISPANANGWLLSATLARRQGQLTQAQQWIERAAALAADDPAIGLEAGAIAVLGGHDDAARKSWQSVVALAPGSPEAKSAQAYLDQLAKAAPSPPR